MQAQDFKLKVSSSRNSVLMENIKQIQVLRSLPFCAAPTVEGVLCKHMQCCLGCPNCPQSPEKVTRSLVFSQLYLEIRYEPTETWTVNILNFQNKNDFPQDLNATFRINDGLMQFILIMICHFPRWRWIRALFHDKGQCWQSALHLNYFSCGNRASAVRLNSKPLLLSSNAS